MWGPLISIGSRVLLWAGTASTGWFLSDYFNESNTTQQVVATTGSNGEQVDSIINKSFWNQKRVIALLLGILALVIWVRRGGLKDKK